MRISSSLALALTTLIAGCASNADGPTQSGTSALTVDNNTLTWLIDVGNAHTEAIWPGPHALFVGTSNDAQFDGTYDSSGVFTFGSTLLTSDSVHVVDQCCSNNVMVSTGLSSYPLLVSMTVTNVSAGQINAKPLPAGGSLSFTATVRYHFTLQGSSALGTTCNSSAVTTLSTANTDVLSYGWNINLYDDTTGQAAIFNETTTFPGWTSTQCGGLGSTMDAALGFAGSGGGVTSTRWANISLVDENGTGAFPTGS